MNLEKRQSYTSKSILSILQTTNIVAKSKPTINRYFIPSSIPIIFSVISIWAIIFYFILGICYYFNPGILLEDLNLLRLHRQTNLRLFRDEISKQFSQLCFHCFFSVCLYFILLFFCLFFIRYREKTKLT